MSARRTPPFQISRRRWATLLGIAPLAARLAQGQATSKIPPQGSPAPPTPPTSPEARLQKAYADVHDTSVLLSKIEVPMNVEPAFTFKA